MLLFVLLRCVTEVVYLRYCGLLTMIIINHKTGTFIQIWNNFLI